MNNDDVLGVLYHHWAVCRDYYPTERQRLQHALLILLCAGTSARPGTVIEGGGYYDSGDALTYGDIKAHVAEDPDNPARKVCRDAHHPALDERLSESRRTVRMRRSPVLEARQAVCS